MVHITDPDFFNKVAKLEGERYATEARNAQPTELSFNGALTWLDTEDFSPDPGEEYCPTDNVFRVYGMGGWNRYYVQSDGFIRFSKFHSSAEKHLLAMDLGFTSH